jgi:malate dehydrogenase (oxaloacetate-decarboxylating)
MLVAAVQGIVDMSPLADEAADSDTMLPLLPGVDVVRDVSVRVARRVILAAREDNVIGVQGIPEEIDELDQWIREQMWSPVYRPLKKVSLQDASRQARGEMRVVGSLGTRGENML